MGGFKRIALRTYEMARNFDTREFLVFAAEQDFLTVYGITRYSPRIDFARNFLVAVHCGVCPTGGYRVTIEDILCRQNHATVRVRFEEPGPDDVVTLVITYPQDTVLVPKNICSNQRQAHFSFVDQRGNHLARKSVTME
ncbi:MAG: protease complex subunit PrcB family protein [Bacillota bacterium]